MGGHLTPLDTPVWQFSLIVRAGLAALQHTYLLLFAALQVCYCPRWVSPQRKPVVLKVVLLSTSLS